MTVEQNQSPPGAVDALPPEPRRPAPSRPPRGGSAPTPIVISPRARAVLLVIALVGLVLLLRAAPSVLTIGLGGAALALVLSFPVRMLSRLLPRGLAILVTLLALVGALTLALFRLAPLLVAQLSDLIAAIPAIATRSNAVLQDILDSLQRRELLTGEGENLINNLQQDLFRRAEAFAQVLLGQLLGVVTSTFSILFKGFATLVVAIYLLSDIRTIKAAYLHLAPKRYRDDMAELWQDFALSLSRYLGGLALSMVIQGALAAVALSLIGVPYPLVLGAWQTFSAIVPFLGAYLGATPAVIVALFVSPTAAILTALAYLGINLIEGNVLTPRIQGQAVRVHPILVFLGVIAAGEIVGLTGVVFAVPAIAVARVLFDFLRARLRVGYAPPVMLSPTSTAPVIERRRARNGTRGDAETRRTGERREGRRE